MRLFVAVYPPAEVAADLTELGGRRRGGAAMAGGINVRRADPATLHVTLAFLGDVPDDRLPDVTVALDRAARRWRESALRDGRPPGPVRIRLGGGGRFGRGAFTVLWVGLTGEVEAVHQLGTTIRRELRRSRLPYDWRPFRPHLTVARPGDRIDRAEVEFDRRILDGYLGPSWPVTEMVLMRSHLGPRPRYDQLAAWQL